MHSELGVNAPEVTLDRLFAQKQHSRDLAVRLAHGDVVGDLALARSECRQTTASAWSHSAHAGTHATQLARRGIGLANRSALRESSLRSFKLAERLLAPAITRERAAPERAGAGAKQGVPGSLCDALRFGC